MRRALERDSAASIESCGKGIQTPIGAAVLRAPIGGLA
ncbi:hypothetical protein QOZ94_002059 [Xanthobacter agilis]|uniref:Uncharacterized protein n=1 Tax=Xanthobacter agilis TaxID=47492 RepID=A0ABU0LDQ6_XANAG|nr:hypothetical protein [Xanthobacter agilis]